MLFAAILPLSTVGYFYGSSFDPLYGYAAFGGGILLCLIGFGINLFAGEGDTEAVFGEMLLPAVIATLLAVLTGGLLITGMILDWTGAGIIFRIIVIAVEVILLIGRLLLLYMAVY